MINSLSYRGVCPAHGVVVVGGALAYHRSKSSPWPSLESQSPIHCLGVALSTSWKPQHQTRRPNERPRILRPTDLIPIRSTGLFPPTLWEERARASAGGRGGRGRAHARARALAIPLVEVEKCSTGYVVVRLSNEK